MWKAADFSVIEQNKQMQNLMKLFMDWICLIKLAFRGLHFKRNVCHNSAAIELFTLIVILEFKTRITYSITTLMVLFLQRSSVPVRIYNVQQSNSFFLFYLTVQTSSGIIKLLKFFKNCNKRWFAIKEAAFLWSGLVQVSIVSKQWYGLVGQVYPEQAVTSLWRQGPVQLPGMTSFLCNDNKRKTTNNGSHPFSQGVMFLCPPTNCIGWCK